MQTYQLIWALKISLVSAPFCGTKIYKTQASIKTGFIKTFALNSLNFSTDLIEHIYC